MFSGDPGAVDSRGRYKTWNGENVFQTSMMNAPCVNFPMSCCWCMGQFIPLTCTCTQYALRVKALEGDMTKYSCFQGYFNCCCFRAGSCGEQSCPELCLCFESCCCNSLAVSATRAMVMDQFDLQSDPCDNRLIRCNNCLQLLACFCDILAMIDESFRALAFFFDHLADLVYHTVSGCMTAQVAHELNFQKTQGNKGRPATGNMMMMAPGPGGGGGYPGGGGGGGYPPQQQNMYPQQQQQVAYAPQAVPMGYPQQGPPQQVVYVQQQPQFQQVSPVYVQQQPQVVYVQAPPPGGVQYVQGPPPGQGVQYR